MIFFLREITIFYLFSSRQPPDLLVPILRAKDLAETASQMAFNGKTRLQSRAPMFRAHAPRESISFNRQRLGVMPITFRQQFTAEPYPAPFILTHVGKPGHQHDGLKGIHRRLSPFRY